MEAMDLPGGSREGEFRRPAHLPGAKWRHVTEAKLLRVDVQEHPFPWFYREGIFREYRHSMVEDRMAFLEVLLKRKSIYDTEYFRNEYEDQARKNITKELKNYKERLCRED